jgi:hypothetical protein
VTPAIVPTFVRSVGGVNVGVGNGLFVGADGVDDVVLNFKSIMVGNGLRLIDADDTIRIEASGVNARFTDLLDGPRNIVSNALLVGSGDRLDWVTVPDTPDLILRWTGGNYQWVRRNTGTVTEVRAVGQDGITITSGSLINTVGTIVAGLADTTVAPGTYASATVVVDRKGRITFAASNQSGEVNDGQNVGGGVPFYAGKTGVSLLFRSLRSSSPIDVVQNGNAVDVSLATTGVVAGTYSFSTVSVDAFGRITAAASGPPNGIEIRQGVGRVPSAQSLIFTGDVTMTVPSSGTAQVSIGGTALQGLNNSVTTGAQVFRNTLDRVAVLRRIVGGGIVTVTEQTDSVLVSATLPSVPLLTPGTYGLPQITVNGLGQISDVRRSTQQPALVRIRVFWASVGGGQSIVDPNDAGVIVTRVTDQQWRIDYSVANPPIGFVAWAFDGNTWSNLGDAYTINGLSSFNLLLPNGFGSSTHHIVRVGFML